jgi:hypothetical protein
MMVIVRQLLTKNFRRYYVHEKQIFFHFGQTKKESRHCSSLRALIASIGAASASAADSVDTPSRDAVKTSLLVKEENGVRSYSTDDGKTWSSTAPDGVSLSDIDGKLTISNGIPPKDGDGKGLLSKVENGVRTYSTDGGKTWSTTAPEGAEEHNTLEN